MKIRTSSLPLVLSLVGLTLTLGCSKLNFQTEDFPVSLAPIAQDSPPSSPPTLVEAPLVKTGICTDQQAVSSCLKCALPKAPPPPPAPLTKAQKLAQIMYQACQIYNRSYPKDYVAPSEREIQNHLQACSAEVYPETTMTAPQTSTIEKLLDPSDDQMRKKLFKGLWYQPPMSDHFELYFGLSGAEAAYAFCMNQPQLTPILYTSDYWNSMNGEAGFFDLDRLDPAARARWNEAQFNRRNLLSCFDKPGQPRPPGMGMPAPAQKVCQYRSFEGRFEQGGREEIQNFLREGYQLSIETDKSCLQVQQVPAAGDYSGKLKISGYRCR